jgi:hypothetical protein
MRVWLLWFRTDLAAHNFNPLVGVYSNGTEVLLAKQKYLDAGMGQSADYEIGFVELNQHLMALPKPPPPPVKLPPAPPSPRIQWLEEERLRQEALTKRHMESMGKQKAILPDWLYYNKGNGKYTKKKEN